MLIEASLSTGSPERPTFRELARRAGGRLRLCWVAKAIGLTFGITAFFAAYFWLLHHPQYPVTVMPLTPVDRWIGFRAGWLPLYLSLWVYVSLAPALLIDRRELWACAVGAAGVSATGLGIFFFWPTAVPRFDLDWSQHPTVAFLKAADAAGNACPSLHVAFAVLAAFWIDRSLQQMGVGRVARALNGLWCAGILFSTLATLQHVALDLAAGVALGAVAVAGCWWSLRARNY